MSGKEKDKQEKDGWDKLSVLLQPVSGVLATLAIAVGGFLGAKYLDQRQMVESSNRLYTELMSRREEADSSLRKDMFNSIIESFFHPRSTNLEEKILNLELLSQNFQESLDLGPLFEMVYRQIKQPSGKQREALVERLEEVASRVKDKQVSVLEEAGWKSDGTIDFGELKSSPGGIIVIGNNDEEVAGEAKGPDGNHSAAVSVEALLIDPERKRVRVRLQVECTGAKCDETKRVDRVFWVGLFNFPMIDNIRLPDGQRCAVILNQFVEESADISFVHFPGSRASVKDKPYYDEVLNELKNTREQSSDRDVRRSQQSRK